MSIATETKVGILVLAAAAGGGQPVERLLVLQPLSAIRGC